MDVVVSEVIHGPAGTPAGRLNTVLSQSYISDQTKREVIQKCAIAAGCEEEALLNQMDADCNPHAVRSKGRLFVLRNDIYLMRDKKDHWSEISNFSIKCASKLVGPQGDSSHVLRLSVEGRTTTFKVTDALLDSAPRLWKAARRAGALAGLPELIMPNGQHRNYLPSLVKQTAAVAIPRVVPKTASPPTKHMATTFLQKNDHKSHPPQPSSPPRAPLGATSAEIFDDKSRKTEPPPPVENYEGSSERSADPTGRSKSLPKASSAPGPLGSPHDWLTAACTAHLRAP
jgi:hypothetical protein